MNQTKPSTLASVFASQREAHSSQAPATRTQRAADLKVLEQIISTNRGQLKEAVSADFGSRSPQETELAEIIGSLNSLRYARRHLRSWMGPDRRSTSIWFLPGSNSVIAQPKGVVGIMSPWNYPIHLTISPLAAAIAAGNRVMLKMSELTPNTFEVLSHHISQHFSEDQIWLSAGEADEAKEFAALPFDHLLFTGSTQIGREVNKAAAANLTPVTLELGGKSPAIVDASYPIDHAAQRIVWGKLVNAGQTCVAPDYALVPKGSAELFAEEAITAAAKLYPDPAGSQDYTGIITTRHHDRLASLVEDATSKGATAMRADMADGDHRKFPLTLLLNTTPDMRVSNEEIFGPILPIVEYDTPGAAVDLINAGDRPLALYLMSNNKQFKDLVIGETTSGGATINDTLLHYLQDDLPFGGSGASGIGSYHGKEGFDTFSHRKGVFHQRGVAGKTGGQMLYPPYGKVADVLLRLMRKI